jgi:hypothetical protein
MNALKQEFKCKLNIAITIKLAQLRSQIGYATCYERITGISGIFQRHPAYVSRTVERHMYSYRPVRRDSSRAQEERFLVSCALRSREDRRIASRFLFSHAANQRNCAA